MSSVAEAGVTTIKYIVDLGIMGKGPLSSAKVLAAEYRKDPTFRTQGEQADALIKWESAKSFAGGFTTGVGGPLAIPGAVLTSWIISARMSAAIAELYGHDAEEDRVQTFILLMMVGDSAKEILRAAGVAVAKDLALKAIEKIPGKMLIEINKAIGIRLLAKQGEKAHIVLVKLVPLVSGVVSGTIDAASCKAVGKAAKAAFAQSA